MTMLARIVLCIAALIGLWLALATETNFLK
jgi:hypothetical protein